MHPIRIVRPRPAVRTPRAPTALVPGAARAWHACCSMDVSPIMPARPLNIDSARSRISQIPDRAVQKTAERAVASALERFAKPPAGRSLPAADFDLLFLVEV